MPRFEVTKMPTGQNVDAFVVFDGKDEVLTRMFNSDGMTTLQSLDRDNPECPWDISKEVEAYTMLVLVLVYRPWYVHISPECTVWCKSQDFNTDPVYLEKLAKRREAESKLMKIIILLVEAINSYGGHWSFENPTFSKFWQQKFWKIIEVSSKWHKGRYYTLNLCRAGGIYWKQYNFFSTLPEECTAHMELSCNHSFRHPPCTGRGADGRPRTASTSGYTHEVCKMLSFCATCAQMDCRYLSESKGLTLTKDIG